MHEPAERDGSISRRRFLQAGAALGVGASAGVRSDTGAAARARGYGALVEDPGGLLDLPPGFQYRVVSEAGGRLSNGSRVPGRFDGMAAFRGHGGHTVLVRNHELSDEGDAVEGSNPYRPDGAGGTTAVVLGSDRRPLRELVTSSGSSRNCAGGATPWGTWITCEETVEGDHGYAFEVDPRNPESRLCRTPIRAMGRFSHEAVAVDPLTGVVYLTEDDGAGGASFLYRYLPTDRHRRPGALQRGGRLEALEVVGRARSPGGRRRFRVAWRRVRAADAHDDAEDRGATRFVRLEGADFADGSLWFDDTLGGESGFGQVFRHRPRGETLELFYESGDTSAMEQPDNVVVAPFGDLLFCCDNRRRLSGVTPGGRVYPVAANRLSDSELAGPAFAPDGRTLFLNVQEPGLTFAIWGPFGRRRRGPVGA